MQRRGKTVPVTFTSDAPKFDIKGIDDIFGVEDVGHILDFTGITAKDGDTLELTSDDVTEKMKVVLKRNTKLKPIKVGDFGVDTIDGSVAKIF